MEIILEAFGILKSQPITVPEETKYKATFRLIQPQTNVVGWYGDEIDSIDSITIQAEFAWSGKSVEIDGKFIPLYILQDIWKEPI